PPLAGVRGWLSLAPVSSAGQANTGHRVNRVIWSNLHISIAKYERQIKYLAIMFCLVILSANCYELYYTPKWAYNKLPVRVLSVLIAAK
ncbi:MAG: hypothetical protein Q6358_13370, partial [Candidatus Brocadiales bacterium]|nr:hypothetical protein [Candidatus Brocadiales bacterium]